MRNLGYFCSLACLLLSVDLVRGGDDDPGARALLAKAIKAAGGDDNLSKIKATTLKGRGNINIGDQKIDFTAEWIIQGMTQEKFEVDATLMGMNFKILKVINGDKGWQSINGMTADLSKDDLAAEKHGLYASHLQQLVPLKDKAYKLAPLGEVKVKDKDAIGISVSCKDHTDVSLYFDKKTYLLLKAQTRVNDQGKEMDEETFFSEYKAVDGVQMPHKIIIYRDGKPFVDGDISEIRLHATRLDDSVFAKP
jgi:hypothetical protein